MATIRARKQADKTTRYTAVVRLRKGTKIVHQEAKTFTHRAAAEKWAKSREVALEHPDSLKVAQHEEVSLRDLIRWYIDNFATVSKWQRKLAKNQEKHQRQMYNNAEPAPPTNLQTFRLQTTKIY